MNSGQSSVGGLNSQETTIVGEPFLAVPASQTPEARLRFWWSLLVRILVAATLFYFLWRVRTIVATVILSLVLACAAQPIVEMFSRRRILGLRPHTQRTYATFLAFILIFAGIGWMVAQLIAPFQQEVRNLAENLPAYKQQINNQLLQVQKIYQGLPPELRELLENQQKHIGLAAPTEWLRDALKHSVGWFSHLAELFLVPVLAFYFTLDGKILRNQLLCLIPRRHHRQTLAIMSEGSAIMRAYIVSQFWLAVIAGVITFAALKLMNMQYAVILGLFAGITRAIPVIGPFIGGVPVTLLTFIHGNQTGQPWLWVWVTLGFGTLHVFESKILMPMFLGHALNLHAAFILIALLVGGEFFGILGMFLAAPVAALLRLLLMYYVVLPRRRGNHPPRGGTETRKGVGLRVLSLARAVRHGGILPSPVPTPAVSRPSEPAPSTLRTKNP